MSQRNHICVCICTYKRPELLKRLLAKLEEQETEGLFDYSIVIVDNDRSESAQQTTQSYARQSKISINYYVEPEQNIALARNKAIKNAKGAFISFIDDDEFPANTWLINLYKVLEAADADGVLGPVRPYFETQPPGWITRGKLLERTSFETGTAVKPEDARTGNVMLARRVFGCKASPFDPRFGRTGGEDTVFFRKMIDRGYRFVWCKEACVYETIPPERYKRIYFLKRALLRGVGEAKLPKSSKKGIIKSLVACLLYTPALSFLFVTRHHLFMEYLIKDCDHIGKLLALCGIEIIRERDF